MNSLVYSNDNQGYKKCLNIKVSKSRKTKKTKTYCTSEIQKQKRYSITISINKGIKSQTKIENVGDPTLTRDKTIS